MGNLPRHLPTAVEGTSALNEAGGENEVYTVKEAEALLSKAPDWLLPTLAIKLFSGIRTEKLFRMDWSALKFDQDAIILAKQITKTRQRRVVPLLPNLKLWLSPFQKSKGPIAHRWSSPKTMSCAWTQFATTAGVPYNRIAMRKSYLSYRIAQIKNLDQVALESGNSPEVIQRDYRELVTEDAAKRWFAISPAKWSLLFLDISNRTSLDR